MFSYLKTCTSIRNATFYILGFLSVVSVIPFTPAVIGPFSVVDDIDYILANPWIKEFSISNIGYIFSHTYFHNYAPLHLLNYMFDFMLWGENAVCFRIENLVWHVLSVWMVFFLFMRLLGRVDLAVFGTLFFAIHPANVETVVWISERKSILSQFFGLASFYLYLDKEKGKKFYWGSILAFFISILSKPAMVVLPLLLLSYQWFFEENRNIKKLLSDKIPFFCLLVFSAITTLFAQDFGTPKSDVRGSGTIPTILNEAVVWIRYLSLSFWPVNLSAEYTVTRWNVSIVSICAAIFLLFIFYMVVRNPQNKISHAPLRFGIIWFFTALLPISNFFPLPNALNSRYFYLPLVGLALAAAYLIGPISDRNKQMARLFCAMALICFSAITLLNAYTWRNSIATWQAATRISPCNPPSYNFLGLAYDIDGQTGKRIEYWGIAEAIRRGLPTDRVSVARLLADSMDADDALYLINKMLAAHPDDPHLTASLGLVAIRKNRYDDAEKYFTKAIEAGSKEGLPYMGMGFIASERGDNVTAIMWLQKAVTIDPDMADAHIKLANLIIQTDPEKALFHFKRALELKPDHPGKENIEALINRLSGKYK